MDNTRKTVGQGFDVPIRYKANLTIDEAVEYSGVSREGLLKMINQNDCPFVLRLGHRRLIKRRAFDEYITKLDFVEWGWNIESWSKGISREAYFKNKWNSNMGKTMADDWGSFRVFRHCTKKASWAIKHIGLSLCNMDGKQNSHHKRKTW